MTVALGADLTCTITNNDQAAQLTLIKTVTNDNGGTAPDTAWTLTADGPTTGVTGPVRDPKVTDAVVDALADALAVPRQQATQIVDRLHEMGMVERVREESDRRVVRFCWSAEGHRYFDPICARFYEDMSARVRALPPGEAQAFLQAVQTLAELLPRMGAGREDAAQ